MAEMPEEFWPGKTELILPRQVSCALKIEAAAQLCWAASCAAARAARLVRKDCSCLAKATFKTSRALSMMSGHQNMQKAALFDATPCCPIKGCNQCQWSTCTYLEIGEAHVHIVHKDAQQVVRIKVWHTEWYWMQSSQACKFFSLPTT